MTNAWSFLHETMFGPEDEHNLTIYAPMNNNPNRYKYDEESILKELSDYISGTYNACLLYTSPSPRDATLSRMPSSA